jgi:hypothetical protein
MESGLFSDVQVFVGPEEHCFKLHKAVLGSNSGYFRRILNSGFREGEESKIYLLDRDKDHFEHTLY